MFFIYIALAIHLGHAQTPALTTTPVREEAPPPPSVDPELLERAEKFCALTVSCNKAHAGKAALCVKTNLKASGLLNHVLGGEDAKDLPRFLRRDGFIDVEMGLKDFHLLRDGSILVLDAHAVNEHKPLCPKVYGDVLVKCGDTWINEQKQTLDFHMGRGCRTKGIWASPGLLPEKPKTAGTPKHG